MVTEKALEAPLPATGVRPDSSSVVCWMNGDFLPLTEAKIGVMTHGFLYGTATFEGIRAYWNEEQGQLFGLKLREHFERLTDSAKVLLMKAPMSVDQLIATTVDLLRRNDFRQDTYIRPTLYKATEAIGVRLHNLEQGFVIFAVPFGEYIAIDRGITAQTVSWRRNNDLAIPARAKITGAYANSAFAKSEAQMNGFDEAIVLAGDGHVSEGSAENLFMVRDGELITPGVEDDILEGVTRNGIMELARRELGLETVVRSIDRSELYISDEVFLCGTGAQLSPVVSVDHRQIGEGVPGPITTRLTDLYFDAVRGRLPTYSHWVTPIF